VSSYRVVEGHSSPRQIGRPSSLNDSLLGRAVRIVLSRDRRSAADATRATGLYGPLAAVWPNGVGPAPKRQKETR
jgi:hypothetical protein